jgi:hypothetical protein
MNNSAELHRTILFFIAPSMTAGRLIPTISGEKFYIRRCNAQVSSASSVRQDFTPFAERWAKQSENEPV